MPSEINLAEFFLDLINTDLVKEGNDVVTRIKDITKKWLGSIEVITVYKKIDNIITNA